MTPFEEEAKRHAAIDVADRLSRKVHQGLTTEWEDGRKNATTVEEKSKYNIWDNFMSDVLPTIKNAINEKWFWHKNTRCKYIELRIDMRDGGCIIKDRYGSRINPEDLVRQ